MHGSGVHRAEAYRFGTAKCCKFDYEILRYTTFFKAIAKSRFKMLYFCKIQFDIRNIAGNFLNYNH